MFKLVKYFFGAALACGVTAAAATPLPSEILNEVMSACRPDYHRVCPDVLPGDGRVGRCLLDHQEQLNPGCLKAVKFAYAVEVCTADYHRFCQDVRPGAHAVQCLARRIGELTPECGRVVEANAPYIDRATPPRYGEYRDQPPGDPDAYRDRPYGDGRYADREPEAYRDERDRPPYSERSYEEERGQPDRERAYPDDRYAGRDNYPEERRPEGEYRSEQPEPELLK